MSPFGDQRASTPTVLGVSIGEAAHTFVLKPFVPPGRVLGRC